jgi:hypothetical protein
MSDHPLIVDVEGHGPAKADDRRFIGEGANEMTVALRRLVEVLEWIVDQIWREALLGTEFGRNPLTK